LCHNVLQVPPLWQLQARSQRITEEVSWDISWQQQQTLETDLQELLNTSLRQAEQAVQLLAQRSTQSQHVSDLQALRGILVDVAFIKKRCNKSRIKSIWLHMKMWYQGPVPASVLLLSNAAAH
jgi:hypothetical protein